VTGDRPALRQHQADALRWIERVGRGLLGDEPGLGKSRVAIEAFDGGRVLVVAPSMVINGGTWADEIARWANHPEGFVVAPYSMLNARFATAQSEEKGYKGGGNAPNHRVVRPEYKGPWDALVVDEAHYTKGRKTSWTNAVELIAKNSGAVLEMTGTPMPNWAHELYTILRVIRPEEAKPKHLFGSYSRWRDTWFRTKPSLYGGPFTVDIEGLLRCNEECMQRPAHDPCEHYHEFVRGNLGDKFLRRLRDEVLTDLPPATRQVVEVPMDAFQARTYRQMKKEYLAELEDGEVVAWSVGSRNVWLDRITTSGWFLDKKGDPRGGKFERLRFDLESRSRPTLVVAHYRDTVEASARLAESLGARTGYVHGGVPSQAAGDTVRAFKEGKLDVLVGTLDLISEGLTLTAADMVIFVEMSWRPSRNEQAARRVHRLGQTRPVTIMEYVTPGTVDAHKRVMLENKLDQQIRVLSAAKFAELL
jgi:SNF2 family DNA or RNA helicase